MALKDYSDEFKADAVALYESTPCGSGCCGTANAVAVAELEASERKLATERDILRKAAKYFAGEANW